MTISFFSNYMNEHQLPLADEFHKILGDKFKFICTTEIPEFRKSYRSYIERPYIIDVARNPSCMSDVHKLIEESDVVIVGCAPFNWFWKRQFANKLTFYASERILKTKFRQYFYWLGFWEAWKKYTRFRDKRTYMLCASAFCASDMNRYFAFPDKCYKWGYFTNVKDIDIDLILSKKKGLKTKLMWCGRFIDWKHPELAIELANRLKMNGETFELNMYGNGPLLESVQKQVLKYNLENYVFLKGSVPNKEIELSMREHHIFLFTSDQNEGWGAVANEAMSNGCVLVGADKIGSVPFLLSKEKNGMIFKSKDIDSLYSQVMKLIKSPELCDEYARNAYYTMKNLWSPENAAKRLLELIQNLQNGKEIIFFDGPCSNVM